MATINPVRCEKCGQVEGYWGCFNCENHICPECTDKQMDPNAGGEVHICPDCGGRMAANAGDRW